MIDLKQEKLEKKLIEDLCPPELKIKLEYKRLNYTRIWIFVFIGMYIVLQIKTSKKEANKFNFLESQP